MTLLKPVFTLDKPNPNRANVTDAMWWFWLRLAELEPTSQLGGILAWKSGFHSTGEYNSDNHPGNYSIRDQINRVGPWWWSKASALDWTFPEAQRGDYRRIDKYTSRLMSSAVDHTDPRLDLVLFEFYGQADADSHVEGYNEYREELATSDSSHLWHIHLSFLRSRCGDFWAMWALLTVLMGWGVSQWRSTLPGALAPTYIDTEATRRLIMGMVVSREGLTHHHVRRLQAILQRVFGYLDLVVDGDHGPKTTAAVKDWQRRVKLPISGVVDADDWALLLTGSPLAAFVA